MSFDLRVAPQVFFFQSEVDGYPLEAAANASRLFLTVLSKARQSIVPMVFRAQCRFR
jgi:hypothetical protein